MIRTDAHLDERLTWLALAGLGVLVAVLCVIAAWGTTKLGERHLLALKKTETSLAAEKATLHDLWAKGDLPAALLTAETRHIDEEAETTAGEIRKLEASRG